MRAATYYVRGQAKSKDELLLEAMEASGLDEDYIGGGQRFLGAVFGLGRAQKVRMQASSSQWLLEWHRSPGMVWQSRCFK